MVAPMRMVLWGFLFREGLFGLDCFGWVICFDLSCLVVVVDTKL